MVHSRPALVIGYGNTLRKDDAVGPLAADAVRRWGLRDVTALSVTQLTPELADPLSSSRLAIFIDARFTNDDEPPAVEFRPLEPSAGTPVFAHLGNPDQLLALAQAVYGCRPLSWLVTIPVADLGLGEGLSSRAAAGLQDALKRIGILLS